MLEKISEDHDSTKMRIILIYGITILSYGQDFFCLKQLSFDCCSQKINRSNYFGRLIFCLAMLLSTALISIFSYCNQAVTK